MKRKLAARTTASVLFLAVALASPLQAQQIRYRLIDLGTFGGPESKVNSGDDGSFSVSVLNNHGLFAGWAETPQADPFPAFCFSDDCYVAHAFEWQSGIRSDLGALADGVSSQAIWVSNSGLIGTPDTAVQALPFTIRVTDSAGNVAKQAYTVSILLEPDTLVASAPSLSFGLQLNGIASSPQTLTLTNNGTPPLVIVNIATGAPDFAAATTCGTSIAASASCTISLTFSPVGLGPSATALTITDNSAGSPHSYALDGVGVTQGPNVTFWSGTSYQFSLNTWHSESAANRAVGQFWECPIGYRERLGQCRVQ